MKRRLEIKTEIQAPFGILALLFLELKSQKHLKKKQVSEKNTDILFKNIYYNIPGIVLALGLYWEKN